MPAKTPVKRNPEDYMARLPQTDSRSWKQLRARHGAWLKSIPEPDEPLYALPLSAENEPHLDKIMPFQHIVAEREFSKFCEASRLVGVWAGRMISYPLMADRSRMSSDLLRLANAPDLPASLAWMAGMKNELVTLEDRTETASDRLLGVVGRLLTEPQFLDELRQLKADYGALPAEHRPAFPLQRNPRLVHEGLEVSFSRQLGKPVSVR